MASGVSGRAWVLISASFATRSGAWRMISKRDVAAHGMAGQREARRRLGQDARAAIAAILSSRMWLATVTGPNRHSAGTTGA